MYIDCLLNIDPIYLLQIFSYPFTVCSVTFFTRFLNPWSFCSYRFIYNFVYFFMSSSNQWSITFNVFFFFTIWLYMSGLISILLVLPFMVHNRWPTWSWEDEITTPTLNHVGRTLDKLLYMISTWVYMGVVRLKSI